MTQHIDSRVFAGIPAKDLAEALEGLEERSFHPGEVVIAEGSAPRALYIIRSGRADVYLAPHPNQEYHLSSLGPGSTIGEMSLFTGQPASASVRAASNLVALILPEERFHALAARFPSVYLNLGAILSERLASTNLRVAGTASDNISVLRADDAPPLLGYTLACSLAWHLQAPVLYLLITEEAPQALTPYLSLPGSPSRTEVTALATQPPRAHAVCLPPTGDFSNDSVPWTLDALSKVYSHVLVQSPPIDLPVTRTVILTGSNAQAPAGTLSVRGWMPANTPRERAATRSVTTPQIADKEQAFLKEGMLPGGSEAGAALGWAARDMIGLKVGLALGAGSAKGYAHIGVLQVLARYRIPIDYIAGTSVGSCVAAAYAMGYSPEEIASILDTVGASIWRPTVPTSSLLSSARMRAGLQRVAGDITFDSLQVPLAVVAADLVTQQAVVYREGLLWPAVLASASIPGIFPPQRIGPHTLVDGGVLDPVPSDVVAGMGAGKVLAVKLATLARATPSTQGQSIPPTRGGGSVFQTIMRAIEVMQTQISAYSNDVADAAIEVVFSDVEQPGIRNFSRGRAFIPLGEAAAQKALPQIAGFLPWVQAG